MTDFAVTQAQVDALWWFHSIDFGDGVISKGLKDVSILDRELDAYFGGLDIQGRSVLDIGAWNGAISFAAKRRGAARVVAADKYVWLNPTFRGREAFDLARSALGLDVEPIEIDVPDLSAETVGRFDVVLFLGVFYHLYDAPTLLKRVAELSTSLLILETHQDALDVGRPSMIFYPGPTLNGDATNFWGPNPECVYEMLKEIGFERIFYQDHPLFVDENSAPVRTRGIFHAFRSADAVSEFSAMSGAKTWHDLQDAAVRNEVFRPAVKIQERLAAASVKLTELRQTSTRCRNNLQPSSRGERLRRRR